MIRIFVLSVCLGLSSIYAEDSRSQTRIDINVQDAALKEVFENIERKTDYIFFYPDGVQQSKRKVSIKARNESVVNILQQVLRPDYTFKIVDRQIIVSLSRNAAPLEDNSETAHTVQSIVTGHIRDIDGAPLPGVSVFIKGSGKGVVTDFDGNYNLEAAIGDVLVFKYLGMETQEVAVRNFEPLNVMMKENVDELSEVVVTGYQTQERRTITGAMAQLKSEVIQEIPVQSFDQAMQGRMAGVLVQSASGLPGGPISIQIRGQGSISAGNSPLFIVDGVEVNSEDSASNVSASNPLDFMDPNDIESIEVLKDAAAASIYGAQAANGVVLITTKSAKAGPTKFTVGYRKGVVTPLEFLEMLNTQQYLNVRMEAVSNLNPDWSSEQARTEVLRQSLLPITLTDAEIAALPTYDWQKEAFKPAFSDKVNVAMTGGSDKTKFRISGSYEKAEATIAPNDFTRGSLYIRLNHDVNDKLNLWLSTTLSQVNRNAGYRSYGSYAYFSSPQYTASLMLPFLAIKNEDGSWNAPVRFPGNAPYNALQAAEYNTQLARTRNLFGVFRLTYKLSDKLQFQSRFGLTYRNYDTEFYIDPRSQEGANRAGYKSFRYQNSNIFTNSTTLTYDTTFTGGHQLNALAGVEYRGYNRQRVGATSEGFPTYQFRYMSSASTILGAYENGTENKRAGAFSQVNYNFRKKYMVSGVLRYDGSSRFGADNQYGLFPAVSVGWDIAREGFMRGQSVANQLKLRLSYGETGNSAISDFASRALWDGSASYGGLPGTVRTQLANDDLRWERNVSYNIGLDFSLYKKILYGSVDIYRRLSKDLLINTPVAWHSGFADIYRNVGEVKNEGLEIDLNSDLIKSGDFKWTANFNIAFLKNRVTKLYEGVVEVGEEGEEAVEEVVSLPGSPGIRVGWPLQTNFRHQYAGVNAATGKPMWWHGEDRLSYAPGTQGGASYTPHGRGSRLSDYFGGLSNSFSYKSFELDVFFQYDMGRELYNTTNTRIYTNGSQQTNSLLRAYEESWKYPGQITAFPRPIDAGFEHLAADHTRSSNRFLEDASYIRLKQISLKYNLPRKYMIKGLDSFSIYATATNVLTWTKWTGYDPEFYIADSNFTSNTGQIPQTRNFIFGVDLSF
ncbi:TonB-dependent receptor [Sinomicrobium soli]|uniref:TonB-dependent receptor n=1 Tax=Sinomicrobium sp. N-1-3-6 TaxID=2219864 RepID=UPI0013751FB9|nr:TonB-dependent receptor [Sinomicrobium sp. N-1-3-6]